MSNNHLENLFNYVRSLGNFQQYKDYADYRQKVYGITEEEIRKEEFEKWKEELSAQDKKQFNFMFDEK